MEWRKSSYSSGDGNCVEIANLPGGPRAVRDSKLGPASPVLTVDASAWTAFTAAAKANQFQC